MVCANQPVEGQPGKKAHGNLITGFRRSDGWSQGDNHLLLAIESSQPFKSFGLELNGKPLLATETTNATGKNVRAHLDFTTTAGEQVILRVDLSPTSQLRRRSRICALKFPPGDFDAVRRSRQQ